MKTKRKRTFRLRGSRIISTISVTLVLAVLGLVALIGLAADHVGRTVRSEMGVVVIVNELASDGAADSLATLLSAAPYVREARYASADEVNLRWQQQLGEEDLPEVNPFQAEYDVKVNPEWSSADSLQAIANRLATAPAVYEVKVHTDMARNVNRTVNTIMLVLLIVAGALLVISMVLIANTVAMEVYAHRVVIHTMQYVGARPGFIRRPYIRRSIINGIIAGVAASAMLAAMLGWAAASSTDLAAAVNWPQAAIVFGVLILVGAAVCGIAACLSANKYLRRSYDEMFQ